MVQFVSQFDIFVICITLDENGSHLERFFLLCLVDLNLNFGSEKLDARGTRLRLHQSNVRLLKVENRFSFICQISALMRTVLFIVQISSFVLCNRIAVFLCEVIYMV